jgi:CRISPR-associated endonuclease/helicase Cas3
MVPGNRDLGVLIREKGEPRNHHGLGLVYPDSRVLEATWRLLEQYPEWRTPEMNRLVVENSLHSEALDRLVREKGERWPSHAAYVIGLTSGQARQADLNLVDWRLSYAEMCFPDRLEQRIRTRLGEDDRLVRFEPPVRGPFGLFVGELTIPGIWARGIGADAETADGISQNRRATRFSLGGQTFVYDPHGLRPWTRLMDGDDDDGP